MATRLSAREKKGPTEEAVGGGGGGTGREGAQEEGGLLTFGKHTTGHCHTSSHSSPAELLGY